MRLTKQVVGVVMLGWLLTNPVFAQLDVTYPVERMVLQRNNSNQASVQIAGSFSQPIDRVEIRFTNRISNVQGTWLTLQNNPTNGQFNGFFTLAGGWYRLEVRGMTGSTIVGTDAVERFGVGEVFAILGHSNAQGSSCGDGSWGYTGPDLCSTINGATDDRVTCVRLNENNSANFQSPSFSQYENTANTDYLPGLIGFEQLGTYVGQSPFAKFAWYWGKLGDLLVQQLGVPVLFYNAGFGGSNMEQTYKSAYDIPFCHWFIRYDLRMPYANLRNLMNLYVPSTGVRAILLQHGENDRAQYDSNGNGTLTPVDVLKSYHYNVFSKVRTDFSMPNLAWLIATSSYVGGQFPNVRDAQYQVSHDTNFPYNIPGPDLDQITARPDGLHFSPTGQEQVAQAWYNTITGTNFLTYTQPYGPQQQPLASIACAPGNQLTVSMPGGYGGYLWNTGATTQSLTVGAGTYSTRIRNLVEVVTPDNCSLAASTRTIPGKVFFPPAITVPASVRPETPTVNPAAVSICAGQSTVLTVTSSGNPVKWNTNAQTITITVQNPGTYSVQTVNPVYGCESNVATATVSLNPAVTALLSSATICANTGPVTLTATGGNSYSFSTGLVNTTGLLSLTASPTPGSRSYSVLVTNSAGCTAIATGQLTTNPAVTALLSSATICANTGPVTLTATGGNSYSFSTGLVNTTGLLLLTTPINSATYTVFITNASGCSARATGSVSINTGIGPVISSVQPGPWNNPATWSCGCVPGECNPVVINHIVTLSEGYRARAKRVTYGSGMLQFGPGALVRVGQITD